MTRPIRLRFAPSPTGSLHIGGARTCLYNFLFAKQHGGQFILRIEDTDQARSTQEALISQLNDLDWLGLHWDEGPSLDAQSEDGDFGPYRQSQRLSLYHRYAQQLIDHGKAYYCFMTTEEIDMAKHADGKVTYQVESPYRDWPIDKAKAHLAAGHSAVVRFKRPSTIEDYQLDDMIRGRVTFPSDMVGDFVILRANGMPVYNFCCVIDDWQMQISHIFRAEEHLSNTLRQMMLYQAFDVQPPAFGHVSMVLGEDHKKLSKRQGAVSVGQFKDQGYLPEALINAMVLLGWTHPQGQEVLTLTQIVEAFDRKDLNAAAPIFDHHKCTWFNAQHIKLLSPELFKNAVMPFLKQGGIIEAFVHQDKAWWQRATELIAPQLDTLEQSVDLFRPLASNGYRLGDNAQEVLSWESTKRVLMLWYEAVQAMDGTYITTQAFEATLSNIKSQTSVKGKALFMPIRLTLSGKTHGGQLKSLVTLIERQFVIERIAHCLDQNG